jgi:type IV pilus assembly protein PilV
MMNRANYKRTQSGGFLLEALIGVLIFSFGILGIVGLQAQSLRHTGDAEYRAEATYFANSLISQMWTDDPAVLKAKYDSTIGGAGYVTFKTALSAAGTGMPGVTATANLPTVLVDSATDCLGNAVPATPSLQGHVVVVCVLWQLPGDTAVHNYTTTGVVGSNGT